MKCWNRSLSALLIALLIFVSLTVSAMAQEDIFAQAFEPDVAETETLLPGTDSVVSMPDIAVLASSDDDDYYDDNDDDDDDDDYYDDDDDDDDVYYLFHVDDDVTYDDYDIWDDYRFWSGMHYDATYASLNAGETYKLRVYNYTKECTWYADSWDSDNPKVAKVSSTGRVTAVSAGKCTIWAEIGDYELLSCTVTVKEKAKLSKSSLSLAVDKSEKLSIKYLDGRGVTWTSSNKKIATVKDGKITAKKVGSCTIEAKIKNSTTLKCKVTVTDPAKLKDKKLTISTLDKAKIKLSGTKGRKVTWSTSNKSIVKITKSDSGSVTIKAGKKGTAVIKAKLKKTKSMPAKTLKCTVKVVDPLTIKVTSIDEEIIYNKIHVTFKNNSKKKVTYVTFNVSQYNNRGDKLDSPYSGYYLNETISAGKSWKGTNYVHDDTKKAKIKVQEVTFSDGSKWKP